MAFLSVDHLAKSYGEVPALAEASFSLEGGDSLAVVGPSGAGKTTLLALIGGLDRPDGGSVLIGGSDVNALGDKERAHFRRETLGFIFQFHHLLNDFSVLENVSLPLLIKGHERRRARAEAAAMLDRVGLDGKGDRSPRELSGGEQQRVAIARALVHRPRLVLADEPTGNLDGDNAGRVFALLCALNRDVKATLVVVTHHTEFAEKLNHRLHLESGRVVSFG